MRLKHVLHGQNGGSILWLKHVAFYLYILGCLPLYDTVVLPIKKRITMVMILGALCFEIIGKDLVVY